MPASRSIDSFRDDVGLLLRRVAREIVLPRFRLLCDHERWEKSPGEIVTVVDREAEAVLERELSILLPSSRVVGEEAVAADSSRLDRLGEGSVWLVDPLDGTANFATGSSDFAIMVALLQDGETVASWMLDVIQDELAYAELGSGAFLGARRVQASGDVPALDTLSGAILTGFLPPELHGTMQAGCERFARVLPGMRCAGLECPAVARGAQHFALFWRTLPWDHAPGALFLKEAGGVVARFSGEPYRSTDVGSGLLLAHNEPIWHSVHEALLGGIPPRVLLGMTHVAS